MDPRPDPLWRQRRQTSRSKVILIVVGLTAVYVGFIALNAPGSCSAPGGRPCSATTASTTHGSGHPTDLVTRTSLGGIHLQDSEATVERMYGPGRRLHQPSAVGFNYPAGLTVFYDPSAPASPKVALVEATSSRFHTATGARIGGSFRAVKSLGHMDCGPTTETLVKCLTQAYGPGLRFDLRGGKVVSLALVLRTN